ncbi:MAG: glycosyltransferase [Candidatus Margulisiibacteriota bacterium]
MIKLNDYAKVVGKSNIEELKLIAGYLEGATIQNVNSTAVGGGVAEILTRMVPLLNELGVGTHWDVIKGNEEFFNVTKAFHNGLHGYPVEISPHMFDIFMETNESNLKDFSVKSPLVIIHDPQPAGLIAKKHEGQSKWVWRCHIDVSTPNKKIWNFLSKMVKQYDASIFSMPQFAQPLPIPQFIIPPSIDPLSDKNKDLTKEEVDAVLTKYEIPTDKPIITQISRFDRLKDPVGVIKAYKLVKKHNDCRLILAGGGASDDPEGAQVFAEVQEEAKNDPDIHLLMLPHDNLIINALQRASTIIIQKSLKEGFGLTISEALWKRKPVVAGAVGGIKLQVIHGVTGYLSSSIEGTANRIERLLNNPAMAKKFGENGREYVKTNFLLTRHLKDYLLLALTLLKNY